MSALLSEKEQAKLASMAENVLLKDSCDILRNVKTPDQQAGNARQPAVVATVKCAVVENRLMATEPFMSEQLRGKTIKTVLVPRGTVVLDSDRLRVTSATGVTYYEVVSPMDPTTYEVVRRVIVERRGQGVR